MGSRFAVRRRQTGRGDAAQKIDPPALLFMPQDGAHVDGRSPQGFMDAASGTARPAG